MNPVARANGTNYEFEVEDAGKIQEIKFFIQVKGSIKSTYEHIYKQQMILNVTCGKPSTEIIAPVPPPTGQNFTLVMFPYVHYVMDNFRSVNPDCPIEKMEVLIVP